jgi:NTP pyrophosphatase (non-canonical NTP hydrolase)
MKSRHTLLKIETRRCEQLDCKPFSLGHSLCLVFMADIASAGNEKLSTASDPSSPVTRNDRSFENLSLDEWLTKFGRIYGKRHDRHTTEYMISRLVEEVAELVNPMESQDNSLIAPNLADVFSWICSLAYKLNIDLSTLAWQKYGKNAPRPAWSKTESLQASLGDFAQPSTLREWQVFISKLYQNENTRQTPMNALVSMMKDVGDLAMMNRKRAPQEQMSSKVASILAWTLAISELLKLDLAKIVNAKYDDRCPVCLQSTCDTDVCHPLANMFVSFGDGTTDEEKYAVLDGASKFGYKTLVNSSLSVQSTRDLSMSRDLISKSDAACIVLPSQTSGESGRVSEYRQIFETLSCYSMLSRGDIWIFAKAGKEDFADYLTKTFASEKIAVNLYTDANHLRALLENALSELNARKKILSKVY